MQCNAYTHQLSWAHILTRGEHRFQYFGCKMVCELEWILFLCFYQQKELMQCTFNSSQQFLPAVWKHQSACADFLSSNTKVTQFSFPASCASSELVSLERMWKNGRRFGILHRLVQPVQPATQRAHNMVRTWVNLEAGGQSGEEIWNTCMAWWALDSIGSKWNFKLSKILNRYAKMW